MSKQPIDNPMGTEGFAFIEFATPDLKKLETNFLQLGFKKLATHTTRAWRFFQQGDIQFIINAEPNSLASHFAASHGASACAMGFKVHNAKHAFERALSLGAKPYYEGSVGEGQFDYPAIYGIGDSLIYFVDDSKPITSFFAHMDAADYQPKTCLQYIDHLTHNVKRGQMDKWAGFYEKLFNFREIRYFDIKGQMTGLVSKALTSPCGKIRIPINESTDEQSQIEEFIRDFKGEGIQHIALASADIYQTVEEMRKLGIKFLDTPDTYYEMIQDRVPWHSENINELKKDKILLDGTKTPEGGLLLQIFTETMLGPVFFEIIQRKGNEGFGEGNFRALFEAIERDQIKRGVLKSKD